MGPGAVGLDALFPVDAVLIVDGVVDHPEVIGGTQMVLLSVDHAKGALLDARGDLRADGVGGESRRSGEDEGGGGEGEFAGHDILLLKLRNECGTEHPKNVQSTYWGAFRILRPTLPITLRNSL